MLYVQKKVVFLDYLSVFALGKTSIAAASFAEQYGQYAVSEDAEAVTNYTNKSETMVCITQLLKMLNFIIYYLFKDDAEKEEIVEDTRKHKSSVEYESGRLVNR